MHCYILNIKATSFMVSEDFLKSSPIIRKLITDPHGMAKLGPKKTVGTIYAGDHKTLLLIARGEGGQFAPKGLYWQDIGGEALDIASY